MFDELLKGARTNVGNFFDNGFDRLNEYGGRLQRAMPGNIVRPIPDTQRVMLREPQPSSALQEMSNSVQKGGGGGSSDSGSKVTKDKMTIKKSLPDGRQVTVNIDLPQDQQQQPNMQGTQEIPTDIQGSLQQIPTDTRGSLQQIPSGTSQAMNYFQQKTPPGQETNQAFPVLGDQDFMAKIAEADKLRPGLGNLLLMQAFFESTLGRNTPNVFGVKPGGESRGFESPSAALDYQLGPQVLGGGANPNMNILNSQEPLTEQDIINLYQSYDPPGAYLQDMLAALQQQG